MSDPLHGVIRKDQFEGSGTAFGTPGAPIDPNPFPKGTKLRMFCGAVSSPSECAFAEELLTKSLHNGGTLTKKGDVVVLDREGSFDRQGEYHVYLYYAELTEDAGNPKDSNES